MSFAITSSGNAGSFFNGESFSYTVTAATLDAGNGGPKYQTDIFPSWLTGSSFDYTSGILSGTIDSSAPVGVISFTVSAYQTFDGLPTGTSVSKNVHLTIKPPVGLNHIYPTGGIVQGTAYSPLFVITSAEVATYTAQNLPPGLTLSTDTVSGTPTTPGTFPVTITGTSSHGTESFILSITVNPLPVIKGAATATALTGRVFTYPFTINPSGIASANVFSGSVTGSVTGTGTTGNVTGTVTGTTFTGTVTGTFTGTVTGTVDWTNPGTVTGTVTGTIAGGTFTGTILGKGTGTGLPPGLYLIGNTISGTPSTTSGSPFTLSIVATNTWGSTTFNPVITVVDPPTINTGTSTDAVVVSFSARAAELAVAAGAVTGDIYTVTASSGSTMTALNVPSWLTFAATGSPPNVGDFTITASAPASVAFITITATAGGVSVNQIVTVVVYGPLLFTNSDNLIPCQQGKNFSFRATLNQSANSVVSTDKPYWAKITFVGTYILISGNPPEAGATPLTLHAVGQFDSTDRVFAVNADPAPDITITSPNTASAQVGVAGFRYAITSTTTGVPATTFNASGLPDGLQLAYNTIAGTPTTAGLYPVTIQASNTTTNAIADLLITVDPAPALVITSSLIVSTVVNQPFSYQITASQIATVYTFGTLPTGITQIATSQYLTGTPTALGSSEIAIAASGPLGTDSQNLILTVTPPPPMSITSASTDTGTQGSSYSYSIVTSTGATSYTASGLPAGITIDTSAGVISGNPNGFGVFTIYLSASDGFTIGTLILTLTIASANLALVPSVNSSGIVTAIYFNLNGNVVNDSLFVGQAISSLSVKNRRGKNLKVITHVDGALTSLPLNTVIFFDVYPIGLSAGSPIVSANAIFSQTDGNALLLPIFSGPELDAAISQRAGGGNPPTTELEFSGEITILSPGGAPYSSQTFKVLLDASLHQFLKIISSLSASGVSGTAFSYTIGVNKSATAFTSGGLPAGLTLDATTGIISGTPSVSGVFGIFISASDGFTTDNATVTITIA